MRAASLFASVLLATAAFAVPTSKDRFAERKARRAAGLSRQSLPNQRIAEPVAAVSNVTEVSYSSNWAGAVLVASTVRFRSVFAVLPDAHCWSAAGI